MLIAQKPMLDDAVSVAYADLLSRIRAYNPFLEQDRLDRAYEFGREAHDGQTRASGEPYFTHPLAVGLELADMHLDLDTIITALLHDTVEDCDVSLEEIEEQFGPDVRYLVDGVTKLTRLTNQTKQAQQEESFRKLIFATSQDIRVLLVKLADRSHNMRTIESFSRQDKKERIARETLDIFAPLAERLGITRFQYLLEDTAFAVLHPEMRTSILTRLEFLAGESDSVIPRISADLQSVIDAAEIECQITGRRKTAYSIWRKMQKKEMQRKESRGQEKEDENTSLGQLSDIMAFRVIVPTIENCYQVLGVLHQKYPMVMGRMKDYISTPKRNGYRSLHTGVIGPMNQKIEVQIRTSEMHDIAERGVAAHWDYKANGSEAVTSSEWMTELVQLLEENTAAEEFLEHTKMEMFSDQVFCFTPKGDLISLPRGATAVDFAYAVHTKVGDTCIGVEINSKTRQLATEVQNGDIVRIFTQTDAQPQSDWEHFVTTGRAKARIRRFVRQKGQEEFSRLGQALLEKEYRFRRVKFDLDKVEAGVGAFGRTRVEEIFAEIGSDELSAKDVFEKLHPEFAIGDVKKEKPVASEEEAEQIIRRLNISSMEPGVAYHLAKCCHPLPGDPIVGIVTTGRGLTVHYKDCATLGKFNDVPELWVEVDWDKTGARRFPGRIQATIFNEPGALAALCTIIGQQAGNISFIQLVERRIDFFTFLVDIDVKDRAHLQSIMAVLRSNKHVESIDEQTL